MLMRQYLFLIDYGAQFQKAQQKTIYAYYVDWFKD